MEGEALTPKPGLAPDEKNTLVMIYTRNALIRGEVVTKESIRVSIWLRTQGAPEYVRVRNAHVLIFGGVGGVKPLNFPEVMAPTSDIIAFHIAPPQHDLPDYDEAEANRIMSPITALVGTFLFKGHIRISSATDIHTSLEVSRISYLSLYNLQISNPYLPPMGTLQVPMTLVKPNAVLFGLHD